MQNVKDGGMAMTRLDVSTLQASASLIKLIVVRFVTADPES
jgi:hypothetical protein